MPERLPADVAVHELADQIGMAVVSGIFLDTLALAIGTISLVHRYYALVKGQP